MPTAADVRGLPLIERPAPGGTEGRPLAVLLSGDGGWSGRVNEIARELGREGISTVGWNSLRYYWRERSPEEASDDLARVIEHYRRGWGAGPVLLVGYSFGADVLPFLANRLPRPLLDSVAEVAVVGFSPEANFEFHFGSWFGKQVGRTFPNHPQVAILARRGIPVLCVNGEEEEPRGCDGLSLPGVKVVYLPGGHSFHGEYDEIARLLVERMDSVPRAADPD
jgi:type IV secretory pathway VirJ component